MLDNTKIIKIEHFKINVFSKLLAQSLAVNTQLMLQFDSTLLKSCSFTATKSFLKLWSIPLDKICDTGGIVIPEFEVFDFYVRKGDLFKKNIGVHTSDIVDLEFVVNKINNKWQASTVKIIDKDSKYPKTTIFTLSTDDLITDKIDDYQQIITHCTPADDMFEFILDNEQILEIKSSVQKLLNANPNNKIFLTFIVDVDNNKIIVMDDVFTIEFKIPETSTTLPKENFQFNILKSDFIRIGNHTFTIYTNDESEKVIFGTSYGSSIIWGLSSKVDENSQNNDNSIDNSIESLNISEYLGDMGDDLPY